MKWFIIITLLALTVLFGHLCDQLIEYESKYEEEKSENALLRVKIEMISEIYSINLTTLRSEKVDSAFILLDLYRDRLHYDTSRKVWFASETKTELTRSILMHNSIIGRDTIVVDETAKKSEEDSV